MSSLIPKIKIGVDTHHNKFDVSAMTHTTSEIGYVQPTYSKLLVPGSKLRIQTRTGSRLSPLFVPTMGEIDIRHYHCFIPFSTIWTPFDAMLTRTNYTLPDGTTYMPTKVPFFKVSKLFEALYNKNSNYLQDARSLYGLTGAIYKDGSLMSASALASDFTSELIIDNILNSNTLKFAANYYHDTDGNIYLANVSSAGSVSLSIVSDGNVMNPIWDNLSFPTMEHCDFCSTVTYNSHSYTICYNFNGAMKRLRTIFMGLGYSFNPFDTIEVSVFKLLAFYKAYWSLFGVNRTYNFFNTYCYKIIKKTSDTQNLDMFGSDTALTSMFVNFVINELSNCTYTCPADYFSASDVTTNRGANAGNNLPYFESVVNGSTLSSGVMMGASTTDSIVKATSGDGQSVASSSPLAQKIALRLLRFVNKNSVVGRSIHEILRSRYGISDIHNLTHEQVERIGADNVPINISAVYNNTDTGEMPLGSYAGLGVGSSRGKKFLCDVKEFGTFITLTAVVPKMGYFQGMLRENMDGISGSMDFFTPEFDAIAWQSVKYCELVADRQFHRGVSSDKLGTNLGVFGFMPTYSHLKVGFNRVLGDISLPSMQDSMLPYTLDRFFPQREMYQGNVGFSVPALPPNEPNYFRSGTRGETNRIFSDVSKTEDHVIMQIFFDMKMTAPMKSLATSFDTFDEDSTHSTDVAHE